MNACGAPGQFRLFGDPLHCLKSSHVISLFNHIETFVQDSFFILNGIWAYELKPQALQTHAKPETLRYLKSKKIKFTILTMPVIKNKPKSIKFTVLTMPVIKNRPPSVNLVVFGLLLSSQSEFKSKKNSNLQF